MAGEISERNRVFQVFDEDGRARNIVTLRTSENAAVAFDLSDAMNPDDALSATVAVTELGSSDLTIGTVTIRHNRVNFNISAGLAADKTYDIQCQATTSEGDVLTRIGPVHGV